MERQRRQARPARATRRGNDARRGIPPSSISSRSSRGCARARVSLCERPRRSCAMERHGGCMHQALPRRFSLPRSCPPLGRTVLCAKVDETFETAGGTLALGANEFADGTRETSKVTHLSSFRPGGRATHLALCRSGASSRRASGCSTASSTTCVPLSHRADRRAPPPGHLCHPSQLKSRDIGAPWSVALRYPTPAHRRRQRVICFRGHSLAHPRPPPSVFHAHRRLVVALPPSPTSKRAASITEEDLLPGGNPGVPRYRQTRSRFRRHHHRARYSRWKHPGLCPPAVEATAGARERARPPARALQNRPACPAFALPPPTSSWCAVAMRLGGRSPTPSWPTTLVQRLGPRHDQSPCRAHLHRTLLRARRILVTYARYLDQGMLPLTSPWGKGIPRLQHQMDATLWFFRRSPLYGGQRRRHARRRELFQTLGDEVVAWHLRHALWDRRRPGNWPASRRERAHATHLDGCKVGDWVVTPCQESRWRSTRSGITRSATCTPGPGAWEAFHLARAPLTARPTPVGLSNTGFKARFWCPGGYLYDVVDT